MKYIITFLCLLPYSIFAQVLERSVIGSTGSYATTSSVQVSSTIGEPVIFTGVSSSIIITQGFHQANPPAAIGIDDPETGLSVNAYPNPTTNEMVVHLTAERSMRVEIGLFDIQGKETSVPAKTVDVHGDVKHVMNLSKLAVGNYLIVLKSEEGLLGTIKVQKVE